MTEPVRTLSSTMIVQIEEVKSVIRALPFVTKLSPAGAHNGNGVSSHDDWVVERYLTGLRELMLSKTWFLRMISRSLSK